MKKQTEKTIKNLQFLDVVRLVATSPAYDGPAMYIGRNEFGFNYLKFISPYVDNGPFVENSSQSLVWEEKNILDIKLIRSLDVPEMKASLAYYTPS